MLDSLESRDLGEAAGLARERASGSWDSRKLCEEIGPIEIEAQAVALNTEVPGTDAGALPVDDALDSFYPPWGCYPANNESGPWFDFEFIPGGAWAFDAEIRQRAEPSAQDDADESHVSQGIAIPGFETAAFTTSDERTQYILVSGPNFLKVNVSRDTDQIAILTAIQERLDEVNSR